MLNAIILIVLVLVFIILPAILLWLRHSAYMQRRRLIKRFRKDLANSEILAGWFDEQD